MIGQPTMNEKSAELAHYGMLLEVSVPPNNRTKKIYQTSNSTYFGRDNNMLNFICEFI